MTVEGSARNGRGPAVSSEVWLVLVIGLIGLVALLAVADAGARGGAAVPACTTHDPTAWHGLVDPVRKCHHDHEHKDDPRAVDRVFGPAGRWFGGTAISYPWQTFRGAGEGWPAPPSAPGLGENDAKHEG